MRFEKAVRAGPVGSPEEPCHLPQVFVWAQLALSLIHLSTDEFGCDKDEVSSRNLGLEEVVLWRRCWRVD